MGQSYGTVMIGKLNTDFDAVEAASARWAQERQVPGFQHQEVMLCDDGKTVVMSVWFDSAESYKALADDPEQAIWYEKVMAPMLDGDPQWLDGTWKFSVDAT